MDKRSRYLSHSWIVAELKDLKYHLHLGLKSK